MNVNSFGCIHVEIINKHFAFLNSLKFYKRRINSLGIKLIIHKQDRVINLKKLINP